MTFEIQPSPDCLAEATQGMLSPEIFNQSLFASNEIINQYCNDCAIELYETLKLGSQLTQWRSVEEILENLDFVEGFRYALIWMLRVLHSDDLLNRKLIDGECYYRQEVSLPQTSRDALRQQSVQINPHNEAVLKLLDTAVAAYPAIAIGEIKGEQALFGMGELQLWLDFFHNDNALYAINNQIAAYVAADVLESKDRFTILEFGAGAGSASDALLTELKNRDMLDRIDAYWVTEPNAFFHRKGGRLLSSSYPDVPFKIQSLDINQLWSEQLDFDRFDLIYSVNTLHVATSISYVLDQAKEHLHQGWFVAGECLRPFPRQPIYMEMIFQILDSFVEVELDESLRPQPGFLTPEQWRGWFEQSGFSDCSIKPDIEKLRDGYDRFITGAISAYYE